jgi:hypothetical protein
MDFLSSCPTLLKVFIVFISILLFSQCRIHLSISLFLGAVILGLWMGLVPAEITESILISLRQLQTISLLIIVGLILIASHLMKEHGQLERMVNSFIPLTKDIRVISAVMPSLIGLLPMPGGALFSAPMVETALQENNITKELKTAINYWFRHVWEYWWPLYPGPVLAMGLLGVATWHFIAVQFPFSVVAILSGGFFLLRPIKGIRKDQHIQISWEKVKIFLWEIMPIIVVILIIIIFTLMTGLLKIFGLSFNTPATLTILLGLTASIAWVAVINRIPFREVIYAFFKRSIPPMLFLIIAIMVFKGILKDSNAVFQIRSELSAHHIPSLAIIIVMPFISGLITGIAIGFVGVAFPLIIPLFNNSSSLDCLAYGSLAYASGYMGMILSPVHLCLLVSKDYFKAPLTSVYSHILKPVVCVFVAAIVIFLSLKAF